jgi:succinylglutamic semialdehyde dehydrogenase
MVSVESILGWKPVFRGAFLSHGWTKSKKESGRFEHVSPANLDWALPPVSYSLEDVETASVAAQQSLQAWSKLSFEERGKCLDRVRCELDTRRDILARLIAMETGKPLLKAQQEVRWCLETFSFLLGQGESLIRETEWDLGNGVKARVRRRPRGVLAVIGPFNYPLLIPHGHTVAALWMGNVVLFKPSERAPYAAQVYAEAFEAAGVPPGVFQMLPGDSRVGARIVRDPSIHGILATCSYDVGIKIQKEISERPHRYSYLAMGGRNSALVGKTAHLDLTAQSLLKSAFDLNGQSCLCVSKVFVQRTLVPELLSRLHDGAKKLSISQPFEEDPRPDLGALSSAAIKERFLRYMNMAENDPLTEEIIMRSKPLEGATKLSRKPLPVGHYVSPSIHLAKGWDSKSAYQNHEVLGPDLLVIPVDDLSEGLSAIRESGSGLLTLAFSESSAELQQLCAEVDTAMMACNQTHSERFFEAPVHGWKNSGNHRAGGLFTLYTVSQPQAVISS